MSDTLKDRVIDVVTEHGPVRWRDIHQRLGDVEEEELADVTDKLVENGTLKFSDRGFYLPE